MLLEYFVLVPSSQECSHDKRHGRHVLKALLVSHQAHRLVEHLRETS
jgi:hypothetical protein